MQPHTHMPHVPQWTQPASATRAKLSPYPIVAAQSDEHHRNFVLSTISGEAAVGISSVEHVFEPHTRSAIDPILLEDTPGADEEEPSTVPAWNGWGPVLYVGGDEDERRMRLQQVLDAEEWEQQARRARQLRVE